MDERPSRAHEPNDQGSHCSTLSLRSTRSARSSPCRIHQRLQLRPSAEDPKGPHPLRIYLQMLDFPARTIQTQSAPENVGTKHIVYQSVAEAFRSRGLNMPKISLVALSGHLRSHWSLGDRS